MRILLTGGSGTVGQKVLEELCENKKYQVTAFDIKNKKTKKFYRSYRHLIDVRYGDLSKKEAINPICKDVDFVIHLAALIPPLADEHPTLAYKINVIGTQNLINSIEAHSANAFVLYASSVSVYGDRLENPLISVGDPLLPNEGDEYAKTKIRAEQVVQESKLDWSILRLSAIMGTDNHAISGLMFHMPLSTSLEITTPIDAARAFVNAIAKKELLSRKIFNLGGGEKCRITYNEFLSKSFAIFGLGQLDFPKHAFADKNFHCGFYADGHELEEILNFRSDTLDSYFKELENAISPLKKFVTRIFRRRIFNRLIKQSEPLKASEENNQVLVRHYFNP